MLSDILANPKKYERNLVKKARKEERILMAKRLLDVLDIETITKTFNLTAQEVEEVQKSH